VLPSVITVRAGSRARRYSEPIAARRSTLLELWWRRYVTALGLTMVLLVTGIVGANVALDRKLARIRRVSLNESTSASSVANFLLIGSDSRAFVEDAQDASQFGSAASQSGQRSDTMMIVHVDPQRKQNLVVSIPRDLVVDIPGRGRQRVNAAFNDGPQKVIDTVKANFGVRIQHYIEVDFAAFQGIVDSIGTVPVYFPYPTRDRKSGLDVATAGCQALDGHQALAYVRSRYMEHLVGGQWVDASPRADLDRIDRQHEFLRKLADTAVRVGLRDPITASRMLDRVVPKLKIDSKMGRGDMLGLVNAFRHVDPAAPGALEMTTLPNEPIGDGTLRPREPDAGALLARLRNFAHGAPAATAAVKPSDVRVQVLNASGVGGLAGRTLDDLRRDGFLPAGTGNAPNAAATHIRYAPGATAKVALLRSRVASGTDVRADASLSQGTDVVVVLGADFHGLAPVGAAAAVPAGVASATASAASSSGAPTGPAVAARTC
jgi:polyisoprenyl-teichoic acid--peptidoglycan teichoic acid transferase